MSADPTSASFLQRFRIRRKISDTLLGAVYECQLRSSHPTSRVSSVAAKCSSIALHYKTQESAPGRGIDDPLREWRVVERLIASGGHRHVVQCYDQLVTTDMLTSAGSDTISGHESTTKFVVLISEYCRGGDLHSFLESSPGGHVTERQALHVGVGEVTEYDPVKADVWSMGVMLFS
ncbi:hypothetical protein ATCC90586_000414 [Pythium insidiosum]|nr:hypothetical protein ATCC90586_000414 [Pythium insidiosum]